MEGPTYAIGGFLLEPHRQLNLGACPVDLGGKALDILSVLAAANGRLVTKDELLDAVWPDVLVEENAIQVHVSAARRALGPEAGKLATVWGRGYRLDALPCDPTGAPGKPVIDTTSIDLEAASLVAQARAYAGRVTPAALLRAIDLHERAIARDPGFAAAWTGLAGTLMVATVTGVLPPERRATARAMAEQAVRVDASSGAPLAIRAVLDTGECRWLEAAFGFSAAIERSPDDPVVTEAAALNLWASIGHINHAACLLAAATRYVPTSPNVALSCAYVAMLVGDTVTAAAQLETATLLGVESDRTMTRIIRTELALATGDADGARTQIAALLATTPALVGAVDDATAVSAALVAGDAPRASSAVITRLADMMAGDERSERARVLLGQFVNWQVRLEALDAAFALAERLVEEGERSAFFTTRAIHPWWRADMHAFRADGRFKALADRLGLATAWSHLGEPDHRAPIDQTLHAKPPRHS